MVGLVIAGPWLTMVGSRVLARRASRPSTIIAGRRLADNPHAGFRSVSGLMLALFVTSVASGVITTIVANRTDPHDNDVFATVIDKMFHADEQALPTVDSVPPGLHEIPGVDSVSVIHANPVESPDRPAGLIACRDLDPVFGRCAAGAEVAMVNPGFITFDETSAGSTTWQAAAVSADSLTRLPVVSLVVNTDGSAAAIERARTVLVTAFPAGRFPVTGAEWESSFARNLVQFQQLANVVILVSLPIAGCSLAVSVAAGLSERKRPLSLLRLAGVQLGVLRKVVVLESAVPLLVVAVVATGTGLLGAQLFLTSQLDYTLEPPRPAYYAIVVAGLVVSLGIIASTLPLLRRITGPETARSD
jgi:hypothetical protein